MAGGTRIRISKTLRGFAWLLAIGAALGSAMPINAIASVPNAFFTTRQISSDDLTAFTKWTSLMPRYEQAKAAMDKQCAADPEHCPSAKWEAMLKGLAGKPMKQKLDTVNRFFNAVTYIEDSSNWGAQDYWATPYEMMTRGADCEDYAIAKFISLRALGVPNDKMRVVILQDLNLGGIMHAVLIVFVGSDVLVLDNQIKQPKNALDIYHYKPIYSINEEYWWRHIPIQ